jgi:WD40 repeat protein
MFRVSCNTGKIGRTSWTCSNAGRLKALLVILAAVLFLLVVGLVLTCVHSSSPIREIVTPIKHPAGFCSIACSPDRTYFAAGSCDGMVKMWSIRDITDVFTFRSQAPDVVMQLCFSSNNEMLAWGGTDYTAVTVADLRGKHLSSVPVDNAVVGLCFLAENKKLLIATQGGKVRLWDIQQRKQEMIFDVAACPFKRGFPDIGAVALGNKERTLAVGIFGSVVFLDLPTGGSIAVQGYETVINALTFSPNGRTVAGIMGEGVALWDVVNGTEKCRIPNIPDFPFYPHCLAMSPNGQYLAIGLSNGARQPSFLRIWDVINNEERLLSGKCHSEYMSQLTWLSANRVATCSPDGTVKVWAVPGL